jgi:fumarate reductase subunit C
VLFFVVGLLAAMLSLASRTLGIVAFVPLVAAPLVALLARYWVAVPAAVAEHAQPFAALRRSSRLTRGERPAIATLVLLMCAVGFGLHWLFTGATDTFVNVAILAGRLFVTVALSALAATVSAVTYHDLRMLKDSVSSAQLARAIE